MSLYIRDEVFKKLQDHVQTKRLLKHSFAVEGAMIKYAKILEEDVAYFGTCGLLHDIDFEEYPETHPSKGLDWLKTYGYDDTFVSAVKGHTSADEPRDSKMAKVLFAVDELASFVVASALVRPTKFEGMQVKSVKKKLKDKHFAAAVNRETIQQGADELNIELADHIENVIKGLVEHEAYLNEKGQSLID